MGLALLRSWFWSCERVGFGAMMTRRLNSGRDGRGRNVIAVVAEIVRRSRIGHGRGRGCGCGERNMYLIVHVGSPQQAEISWSRLFVEG